MSLIFVLHKNYTWCILILGSFVYFTINLRFLCKLSFNIAFNNNIHNLCKKAPEPTWVNPIKILLKRDKSSPKLLGWSTLIQLQYGLSWTNTSLGNLRHIWSFPWLKCFYRIDSRRQIAETEEEENNAQVYQHELQASPQNMWKIGLFHFFQIDDGKRVICSHCNSNM